MPGYPPLDPAALQRLRDLVARMNESTANSVPMSHILEMARDVDLDAGVTVDFQAAEQLGQPMVVLRMRPDAPQSDDSSILSSLTRREREIAGLIAEGLSNKALAQRLHISLATVKDHVHRILHKTGLANRAAVASVVTASSGPKSGKVRATRAAE